MFEEFSEFKEYYISECKECGTCFTDCFAYKKTKFPIFKHLKGFYRQQYSKKNIKRIKKFLNSCIYCKRCEVICPNGLKLSARIPSIKFEIKKIDSSYVWSPQYTPQFLTKILNPKRLDYFFRNITNEIVPKDFRVRFENNRKPQKREIIFFTGCGIQALENQYILLLDILKKLNVDFGLVEGSYLKPTCCGTIYFELGHFEYGVYLLKNLLREVKKFKTKKVMVYCASCYYSLKTIAPQLIEDYDLEIIHASGYLADILKKQPKSILKSPKSAKNIITIHDSCHLAHSGDTVSIRKLLNLFPNIEIREMKHNKEYAICDASCIIKNAYNPLSLLYKKDLIPIYSEAIEIEANELCTLCPGCHSFLTIFGLFKPILIKNWVSILGEYLGLRRRDMLRHRLTHFIDIPFRDSGLWFLWKSLKSLIRGYFGMKDPK